MSYQALYRKYRPQRFDEVVGQRHITTILKNQILSAQASHAYLFCGSRGTGKTSTAKIFSRTVNCLNPIEGEACGACEACILMRDETVDIIEIDAASNNRVDDIRALIEQARFTPLSLHFKVYIIDEVHMLSNAASNALLKTLEEPPAHVLFLLATTEPQSLLPTIISRCQRFDFKRLSVMDIVDAVRSVTTQAGAQIDEEGLRIIAHAADGGLRDALSLADQCISFCGMQVSARDVYDVLGSMDQDFLFDMSHALLCSDAARALRLLDEVIRAGRDLSVFAQDISGHLRAVLLAQTCGDCQQLLDCTIETMARYREQAKAATQERLLRGLDLLTNAQNNMKWLGQPRVLLEAVLVRICRPEDEQNLLALQDRVAQLESAFKTSISTSIIQANIAAVTADIPALASQPTRASTEPSVAPQSNEQDVPPWAEEAPTQVVPEIQYAPNNTVEAPASQPEEDHWEQLKALMKTHAPNLFVVTPHVQRASVEGSKLVLHFASSKETFANMFLRTRNAAQLNELLGKIANGMEIAVRIQKTVPSGEHAQELFEIFGDKLIVRE